MSGSEWSAATSWRFLDSITSVGRRVESTASLGVVAPGPQSATGLLGELHRAPGVHGNAGRRSSFAKAVHVDRRRLHAISQRPHTIGDLTRSHGVRRMAIVLPSFDVEWTNGTTVASSN